MRWLIPSEGVADQIRHRSGFLFFPMEIEKQKRWLEIATWEEISYIGILSRKLRWLPTKWL